MSKIEAKIRLRNYEDEILVKRGLIPREEITGVEAKGVVDTGATMLCIPEEMAQELGVPVVGKAAVKYANGEREERPIIGVIKGELEGREGYFEAIKGRKSAPLLIGQIVLERLDLHPDMKEGVLKPRPESPEAPLIEIF